MELRALMDAHRVRVMHLMQFCESHNIKAHRSEFSKILHGRIVTPKRYKALLRAALYHYGVPVSDIDSVPELQP